VRVGEEEFPSFPRAGGDERERVALFGVPFDHAERSEVRLFAEDAAGNRAEAPFLDAFKARPPRRDVIRLSDSFLERVVPPIESRTPQLSQEGSLVERYVAINDGLRKENRASIDALASRSTPPLLVSGGLYTMRNAARMAGFAETRRYLYEGEEVDQQTHLGLDLASTAQAEVPAAAPGRVVFADYMGIYGNAVVVDHGMGLLTLYAHLSSIGVGEGEEVAEGAIVGRSGQSGLAGGDHLHFGVFVHGVAVEPIEWIDGNWVRNRILRVIEPPSAEAAAS
jgi:murein DD-endopeptidase MepM/ murein hydrolase activator NlpD